MPDTLLWELRLISLFLFTFTATTVDMLLLLHTPFLPLPSWILHLVKAGSTIQHTVNYLITGTVTGNILLTSDRAGATVLKEMAMETTYNASSSKHSCIGG
jgi:hypothetical protein